MRGRWSQVPAFWRTSTVRISAEFHQIYSKKHSKCSSGPPLSNALQFKRIRWIAASETSRESGHSRGVTPTLNDENFLFPSCERWRGMLTLCIFLPLGVKGSHGRRKISKDSRRRRLPALRPNKSLIMSSGFPLRAQTDSRPERTRAKGNLFTCTRKSIQHLLARSNKVISNSSFRVNKVMNCSFLVFDFWQATSRDSASFIPISKRN